MIWNWFTLTIIILVITFNVLLWFYYHWEQDQGNGDNCFKNIHLWSAKKDKTLSSFSNGTRWQDDLMKKNFKEIFTRLVMLALGAPDHLLGRILLEMSWNLARSLVTDESYRTLSSWMFSIIYILKFPTFYKNLCEYRCSQLSPHKFFWKIYFKMLSWYELAIPISYATSSTFSFLQNIVRSLKRNLDDFQVHLLDELQYRFNYSLRLRQLKIIRKFHAFCLNMLDASY